MDHFNATVHNGALVSTRRGLHVSKTKHQGTRFVNTFAAPVSPKAQSASRSNSRGSSATSNDTKAPERKFRFVARQGDKPKASSRGRPRVSTSSKASTPYSSSESGEDGGASARDTPRSSPSVTTAADIASTTLSNASSADHNPFGTALASNLVPSRAQQPQNRGSLLESKGGPFELYLENGSAQSYLYDQMPSDALLSHPQATYMDHGQEDSTILQHLSPLSVEFGRSVEGSSNNAQTTPHMHLGRMHNQASSGLYADNSVPDPIVLDSIASEALNALVLRGDHDQWHTQMKDLRYLVNRTGGLQADWGQTLNKIRKADVKGAAYTGTTPYFDFTKFFSPISDLLSREAKSNLAFKVQQVLGGCKPSQDNLDSMSALVFFGHAAQIARQARPGSFMFDPNGYIEEHLWIEQLLVRYPSPLRDTFKPYGDEASLQDVGLGLGQPFNSSPFLAHQPTNVSLNRDTDNLLDSFIRLTAILYMEELLPEVYTIEAYSLLLSMLHQQTRKIAMHLRARHPFLPAATFAGDGLPSTAEMRPLLLWGCMVAYAVAKVADGHAGIQPMLVDVTPYQDCISLLVGSKPDGVDGLSKSDFALCKLLSLQELRTVNCDDQTLLKQIVAEYASRQLLQPMAPYL